MFNAINQEFSTKSNTAELKDILASKIETLKQDEKEILDTSKSTIC
jgi:hypothetical protein